MAAKAAEEAEKLRRALEDTAKALARAEGVPFKEYVKLDKVRRAAARAAAAEAHKAEAAAATAISEGKAAAAFVASFSLPFRRDHVWKELAKASDSLDYPETGYHTSSKHRAVDTPGSSGIGLYDHTRQASAFVPGLIRKIEARSVAAMVTRQPPLEWELLEARPPEKLRWRMLQQAGGTILPVVGEDIDPDYTPGDLEYRTTPFSAREPELMIVLVNTPFGTQVQVHYGVLGRFATEEDSAWSKCLAAIAPPLLSCTLAATLKWQWRFEMAARGYQPVRPNLQPSFSRVEKAAADKLAAEKAAAERAAKDKLAATQAKRLAADRAAADREEYEKAQASAYKLPYFPPMEDTYD